MTVFWFSMLSAAVSVLAYVYAGYGLLLRALVRPGLTPPAALAPLPSITVMLTVHNEAPQIEARLANLLAQDYPPASVQILVVSDGSTDQTEPLVLGLASRGCIELHRAERLGKSGAQNAAFPSVRGDILFFTDAGARFAPDFLRRMAGVFADPDIGGATGGLRFEDSGGGIGRSQGFYWRYELMLRDLESRLGILAVASGQAMAVRRTLFRPLPLHVGDDCVVPLDVVRQGFRFVHVDDARAFDTAPASRKGELRARIRMTMRNWTGTWLYPDLLNPLSHPGYAFGLWSHKLLRWLGGLTLPVIATSLIGLGVATGSPWSGVLLLTATVAVIALGGIAPRTPLAGFVFSFALANLGFAIGVWRGLTGQKVATYKSGS